MKKKMGLILLLLSCVVFSGCGNAFSETASSKEKSDEKHTDVSSEETSEEPVVMHKLYFDVDVTVPNDVLNEHSIELYLDENLIHRFEDNKYYTELLDAEEGNHTISLKQDDHIISELSQNIDLFGNMSAAFVLGYGESLDVTSYETKNSIEDSAILYDDMSNIALDKAVEVLTNKHFVNVRYEANDDTSILDLADWLVVKQNVTPGSEIDKAEEIVLTCRKVYHQLYFDLAFDENLFLATYDIDVYLDGERIDSIPHGKNFTYLTRIKEGDHLATFYKSTDNSVSAEKKINVSTDSTLSGRLHSNRKDIELKDFELKNSIENTSFEVANVEGMVLEKALSTLSNIGFINLRGEPYGDIWDRNNWIVVSQSVKAGEIKDKNTAISLNCVKKTEYLTQTYLKLTIPDAVKKAEEMNNSIRFVDYVNNAYMDNKVSNMSEEEKKKWIVKQASYDADTIKLSFVYTGNVEMPDLKDKTLTNALDTLKKQGFSAIQTETVDGSFIWNNDDWKVSAQSVQAGVLVNANGVITLTVKKISTESASSSFLMGNYLNKDITEVRDELQKKGIKNVKVIDLGGSETTETRDMIVVEQSVPSGTTVNTDETVTLTIAKISAVISKKISGLPLDQAIAIVHLMGYKDSNIKYYYTGSNSKDITDTIKRETQKDAWIASDADMQSFSDGIIIYCRHDDSHKEANEDSSEESDTLEEDDAETSQVEEYDDSDEIIVYVTTYGTHYHYSKDCAGPKSAAISLNIAKDHGMAPCSKCVH